MIFLKFKSKILLFNRKLKFFLPCYTKCLKALTLSYEQCFNKNGTLVLKNYFSLQKEKLLLPKKGTLQLTDLLHFLYLSKKYSWEWWNKKIRKRKPSFGLIMLRAKHLQRSSTILKNSRNVNFETKSPKTNLGQATGIKMEDLWFCANNATFSFSATISNMKSLKLKKGL